MKKNIIKVRRQIVGRGVGAVLKRAISKGVSGEWRLSRHTYNMPSSRGRAFHSEEQPVLRS